MDGGKAFFDRADADDELKDLVGIDVDGSIRVEGGWPENDRDSEQFPLVTHLLVAGGPIRPGLERFRLQVTTFAWVSGDDGGPEKLAEIEARLFDLFDEAHWQDAQGSWRALALDGADLPAAPGNVIARRRDFEMDCSEAAV